MKVILLKDVRGCGGSGQVCDVSDGYARNFLFPKKYAEAATDERLKQHEASQKEREAKVEAEAQTLDATVQSLHGKTLTIAARATEKGGLFKSITPGDIAKAIRAEHNLELPESAIDMSAPIKILGEHDIKLESKSQKATLKVSITPQQ